MITIAPRARLFLIPLAAAFALGACSAEPEEPTYATDTEDMSGGELIVNQEDAAAVPVDLPETEMTSVPVDEAAPPPTEPATGPVPAE